MRKYLNLTKNILALLAIFVSLGLLFNELRFLDRRDFLSPFDKSIELRVRSDSYGKGHFKARRKGRRHSGLDLAAPLESNVRAVKSGWVVVARESRNMGKHIELYHKKGLVTVYGHLKEIKIRMLQRIRQGEIIGSVGKSGNAGYKNMKAHLHLEVIKNGQYQDPAKWLPSLNK